MGLEQLNVHLFIKYRVKIQSTRIVWWGCKIFRLRLDTGNVIQIIFFLRSRLDLAWWVEWMDDSLLISNLNSLRIKCWESLNSVCFIVDKIKSNTHAYGWPFRIKWRLDVWYGTKSSNFMRIWNLMRLNHKQTSSTK